VSFTLTSSSTGIWNVYDVETGGAPLTNVSAVFEDSVLTLTASGDDLVAGVYYVSVTENEKSESARLGLTVGSYVAPGQSATPSINPGADTVAKTAATQQSVSFVLTSSNTGVWNVYDVETGGAPLTTISAVFAGSTLTLTASGGDLSAATYYVSVTESGKSESVRLGLTVGPYAAPVSATPTIDAAASTVAKTSPTQKSVSFTLTSSNMGVWNVYDAETGGAPLSNVSAVFEDSVLTLTASGDDLAAATYYVSVTESGKSESARLGLT
jgi:hypothetical protein